MTRISNVRKTTKFKRSIKAISPVIATLLMIAIAVVASLVVYAWVTGYIGGTTSNAGKAIQIQSFASMGGNLVIYVQNVGQADVQLKQDSSVYVNNDLEDINESPAGTALTPGQLIPIDVGQTVELLTDAPYTAGTKVNIKVTTTDGTFMTTTGAGTSSANPTTPPGGNVAPTAAFTSVATGLSVAFTDASTDSDGTIASWSWAFGDGATSTQQNPTHVYASANTYTVRLTVTDDDGATDYQEHPVTVAAALQPIYVTSMGVQHDNPNVGTHSNFAYMQDVGNLDTLTEVDVGSTQSWVTPTADSGGSWSNRDRAHDGSTTNYADDDIGSNSWSDWLTLSYSSTTGTGVRYWVSREGSDIDNMEVEVYNTGTSTWQSVFSGAPTTTGQWVEQTFASKTTNAMRIRFYNTRNWENQYARVYETAVLSVAPPNYQLDLEVRFSGVTNFASYTQLQINTGTLGAENLAVYYWNGASYALLTNALAANTLNTYTVSLTGQTFDLRFYDTTRTSDTTQSAWQIDYVRLVAP